MNDPFRSESPAQRTPKPGECPLCSGFLANRGDVGPTWRECSGCGYTIGRDKVVFEGELIEKIAVWLTAEGHESSAAKLRDGSWRGQPT